jgi:pimeloyl-ACP methyl ester carboxylesterase
LDVGSVRFEILHAGPDRRDGPSLVLLHEGLGSAHEWTPLVSGLVSATGWGTIAYSRRGYGASSPVNLPRPLDYLEREAREVLPEILDRLGIARCVLVGHSDGATIAALAAASGDPRILGAVLFAPHVTVEDVTLAGIAEARRSFGAGPLRHALERRHADVDGAFRGWCDAWQDPARRD